jgi:hypothetical protein
MSPFNPEGSSCPLLVLIISAWQLLSPLSLGSLWPIKAYATTVTSDKTTLLKNRPEKLLSRLLHQPAINQHLGDLHGVEGCSLAQVI